MGLYKPFNPFLAHGLTVWYPEWQQPKSFVALTSIGIFHSRFRITRCHYVHRL